MKARTHLEEILNLRVFGVTGRERFLAMLVCASELSHLQRNLHYVGCGCWHAFRDGNTAARLPWEDYVKNIAGFHWITHRNYAVSLSVLMDRVRASDMSGRDEALALLEAQPSTLTPEQRQAMIGHIEAVLKPGENQSTLRREFRRKVLAARPGTGSAPGTAPDSGVGPQLVPSKDELGAMAMAAWFSGSWPADLEGQAAQIAAMAMQAGASEENADKVAKMILLDEGRGFPKFPE